MPDPIRPLKFAAVLLFAMAAATPGSAEMTEADKAGIRAFAACLDETGGDEEACLKELGYYAWYPKDGACKTVVALVHEAITDKGQAEWRELFLNERCARLDMPHDREAAAAGDTDSETLESSPEGKVSRRIYLDCIDGDISKNDLCLEKVGRYRWYDEDIYCGLTRSLVRGAAENREIQSWKLLFENERCHRRRVWHYEPAP